MSDPVSGNVSERQSADSAAAQHLPFDDVGAVVLAGGMARRMGGVDKGLVSLAGRPMASYAVQTLIPIVSHLVINANRHAMAYASILSHSPAISRANSGSDAPSKPEPGIEVIADNRTGFLGPLAGLSAALAYLPTQYVLLCPCDSPFVQRQLMIDLVNSCRQADMDIAVAHDGKRLQPVFCVVHRRVENSLNAFLDSGERKIDRWFSQHTHVEVDATQYLQSFRNINTAEELAMAEKELSS